MPPPLLKGSEDAVQLEEPLDLSFGSCCKSTYRSFASGQLALER